MNHSPYDPALDGVDLMSDGRDFGVLLDALERMSPYAGLLQEHGQQFTPYPYSDDLPARLGLDSLKPGHCFETASRVALGLMREAQTKCPEQTPDIKYGEGLAWTPDGLKLHAWVIHGNQAIDVCWQHTEWVTYFGIGFPPDMVAQLFSVTKKNGLICYWGDYADMITEYLMVRNMSPEEQQAYLAALKAAGEIDPVS